MSITLNAAVFQAAFFSCFLYLFVNLQAQDNSIMKTAIKFFFALIIANTMVAWDMQNAQPFPIKGEALNDSIQGVFFDAHFGDTKQDVIKHFKEHGLEVQSYVSTDDKVHFTSKTGGYFSFGGFTWEMLRVGFDNGRLNYISFYNASKDKASALQSYEGVAEAIAKKYKVADVEATDTTVYACKMGYSAEPNRIVNVACYRYETISRDIMIAVDLTYSDNSYKSVSDEL